MQVQATKFTVHISYFLQKCKKGKFLQKMIRPIENCIYAIKAKMSDILQVFEVDDILTRKDTISGLKSSLWAGLG